MCIVLGILILALLAYIVYLYASYYRIEDNQELVVEAPVDDTTTGAAAVLATDTEYSAVTYNIGFGAYLPDYSFFMDGGTSSWAESTICHKRCGRTGEVIRPGFCADPGDRSGCHQKLSYG